MALVQFETLASSVEPTFWHRLSEKKVNEYRLDDSPKSIFGSYTPGNASGVAPRLVLGSNSFDDKLREATGFTVNGVLKNTNTIEAFKALDKAALLKQVAQSIWNAILSGEAMQDPSLLNPFVLVTFADLKKYKFYYWFAFPALLPTNHFTLAHATQPTRLKEFWLEKEVESLRVEFDKFKAATSSALSQSNFFLVKKSVSGVACIGKLSEWNEFWDGVPDHQRTIGFTDPSNLPTNASWLLRNFLLLLKKQLNWSKITIICYRESLQRRDVANSIVLHIDLPGPALGSEVPKSVGWEKNLQGKLAPRMADLAPLMDPTRLAETAVDLNLKLMRWRIMPILDLEKISGTKCLLLGSGTLGCYVARALMAWGVRHITFVDNGVVSFSNPVRQPLFNYEDSLDGGKIKSVAAADALKKIFPGIISQGHNMTIPMPGHPATSREALREDLTKLESLIRSHDAIFLLTDSREARWLPTVIGALEGKIVINSALGFDTFLVMRHGMRGESANSSENAGKLGCYYCNDVVAPSDSLSDRTLDQQCTVTRPGLSLLASSQAVELLVSILNHPQGVWASADGPKTPTESTEHPLGLVPHQIRGYLTHFTNMLVTGQSYDQCTACSPKILEAYKTEGVDFVMKALASPKYLEELTGLSELHKNSEAVDVDWDEGGDIED